MKTFEQLQAGQFYTPVFERLDAEPDAEFFEKFHTGSPFYQYLGGKEFVDEGGNVVNGFYDPELQMYVSVDSPDGFAQ